MRSRVTAFAPGRVNLIGEHTDYNDGLGLPFAIERGVTVTATALDGNEIEAVARDLGEQDRFKVAAPPPAKGWRAFVRGVAAELAADGLPVLPARLEISGDLEQGSGLSSSAALEVALCLALLGLAEAEDVDRLRLARLCSHVENNWVGARTGVLDQTASLCGRDGHALRIDFRDRSVEPVPLRLGDWTLVTVDSGEQHSNASGGYNERRDECMAACEQLGLGSLRDASADALARLPDPLNRRARHVLEENDRVDRAVDALRNDDLATLARLLDSSHASLRDLYDASTPAVERTVAALSDAGAAGARMVGGGFGGHVLGLLPPGVATPPDATMVTPGDGARLVDG
ncbi:MAG TPA: galactokinase family protein [Thermoleophilaceae bacterium]|nr:galactokinase family protein [Thermoleophilaceae bacterium]